MPARFISVVIFILVMAFAAGAQNRRLVFDHANVVDVESGKVLADQTIEVDVEAGRIISVHKTASRKSSSGNSVNLSGKYVIPGLWDMHTHVAGLSADPKWSRSLLSLLLAKGVTGIRDMGGSIKAIQEWRAEMSRGAIDGPEIVAAGPMLDAAVKDPNILNFSSPAEARAAVDSAVSQGADFVKLLSDADPAQYEAIAGEAKKIGRPFVGHVPPAVSAFTASNSGQKSIEHFLYGGIAIACSSRETELMPAMQKAMDSGRIAQIAAVLKQAQESYDAARCASLWETFRKNGTWFTPTLASNWVNGNISALAASRTNLEYVSPQLAAEWTPATLGKFDSAERKAWFASELESEKKLVKQMSDAGVGLLAGSDSLDPMNIPGFSLHRELQLLVESGLTPLEALRTATLNPNRYFDRKNGGQIAAGYRADLVILDANPLADIGNIDRISGVVRHGKYFGTDGVQKLLEQSRVRAQPKQ